MEMKKNKRGVTTIQMIIFIFVGFFLVAFLVAMVYGFNLVGNTFNQLNVTLGNNSFQQVYNDTIGPGIDSLQTTTPQILGIGILLGMFLVMMGIGYFSPKRNRAWIILDILILILAEGLAVTLSTNFTSYVNSSAAFLSISRDTLPYAAKFILALPTLVPILGALIIGTTYLVTKDKKEESNEFTAY